MTHLAIDHDTVRWAVDGRSASRLEALTALNNRPLLLLMHGFGSFEGDLIELAAHLPQGFVCASPRAPLVAPPPIVNGYSWWPVQVGADGVPIRLPEPEHFESSPPHAAALTALDWLDTLDQQVAEHSGGGGLGAIAIMGFSQGGCMVTSLLRLRPERFACGVNCSGFLAPGSFDDSRIREVMPAMFWGRDEADPVVTPDRIELTSQWAPEHTSLEARLYPGIAHGISLEELTDISSFLVKHVPLGAKDSDMKGPQAKNPKAKGSETKGSE